MMTGAPSKLLVVEDDADDLYFLKEAISRAKVEANVDTAANGEEAVGKIAAGAPTLVLLDLKLPLMSGLEVLKWMRERPASRRVPVLILTASLERSDIEKAYDLGANAYLCKPATLAELSDMMEAVRRFWLEKNRFPQP